MKKKELLKRIEALETQLDMALARIATLEARPINWPGPQPADIPWWRYTPQISPNTAGDGGGVLSTAMTDHFTVLKATGAIQ